MRLAYPTRPGIPGPSRKAAIGAVCLAAAAGFYGFATSVQKAATLRGPGGAVALAPDDSRPAVGVAATPTLVYAVTDRPSALLAAAEPSRAAPAPAAVTAQASPTEDITLISQPLPEPTAEPLAIAPAPLAVPPAPAASDLGAPASAVVEAQPNMPTPLPTISTP